MYVSSVAKYSTRLWYPESWGGEEGIKYLNGEFNSLQFRGINWGKVVLSDALGIVSGATTAVVAGGGTAALPLCGGIPCASVLGLISGATGSAYSILGQI